MSHADLYNYNSIKDELKPGSQMILEMATKLTCNQETAILALDIFRRIQLRVYTKQKKKGKGKVGIIPADEMLCGGCIMLAIKSKFMPITVKQVVKTLSLDEKLFTQYYIALWKMVFVKSEYSDSRRVYTGEEYISSWCTILKLPLAVADDAKQLLQRVKRERILDGKMPSTIASAVICSAASRASIRKSFTEIATVANLDPSTVRIATKRLNTYLALQAPPELAK
jgi:hypothetical protein